MQINLNSGESLTAVQGAAITTTAPTAKVDYNDGSAPRTAMASLSGVTAVTLLSGPTNGVRSVRGVSVLNGDTVAQTITINHVQGGTSYPVATVTLSSGDMLVIGDTVNVLDSSGNVKLGFASSTTTFTGDVTMSNGKDIIFSGTTGQCQILVTDNLASALVIGEGSNAYITIITTDSSEAVQFSKQITLADAVNIVVDTTTGTKIGTATTQKLGFFNATPVVQRSAYTQTYSTADKTHANPTAVALTDNSGGTANTTIQALSDGTTYANDVAAIRNNFADLAASDNAIIVDLADLKQLVNSVIDDLQALGFAG